RNYAKIKRQYYKKLRPEGLTSDDIWVGENGEDKNAVVTVLRHQWTASAHQGQLGKAPRSVLLLDFANFERYFYLCNVATEVSEAMLGQSRVVTYLFDVKKEAENLFLSLIPHTFRKGIRASLVEGLDPNYEFVNDFTYPYKKDNGYDFESLISYKDFIKEVLTKTFKQEVIGERSFSIKSGNMSEDNLQSKLENLVESKGGMATHMPNVSYLRVQEDDGSLSWFTITANRYYKTRNQLSFTDSDYEKTQRKPSLDTLEIYEGIFVNYPEKIYMIDAANVDKFLSHMKGIKTRGDFLVFNMKYGLDQNAENFWQVVDEMNTEYIGKNPVHGGIIDLHKYGSLDLVAPL
ncbi:MAG: hypothetical protein EP319_14520, partial [Deltaproteobacteria bacterium]